MSDLQLLALIDRLNSIARYTHFDWHLFLIILGIALWSGLAIGPALLVGVLGEFFGGVILSTVMGIFRPLK